MPRARRSRPRSSSTGSATSRSRPCSSRSGGSRPREASSATPSVPSRRTSTFTRQTATGRGRDSSADLSRSAVLVPISEVGMTAAAYSIDDLLKQMKAMEASDLHLTPGSPPVVRVRGQIVRLESFEKLVPDTSRDLMYRILSSEQQKLLETNRNVDLAYSVPGVARFRVNVYFQR